MINVRSNSAYIQVRKESNYNHNNPGVDIVIDSPIMDRVCNDFSNMQWDLAKMLEDWKGMRDAIETYPAVAQAWADLHTIKKLCEESK